ncbi:MAG: hypothetical protein AAGC60_05090 [Acidobacteriota bacterium]
MSMYVDPTLVAGFAAEVRSQLPEVRQALARFEANNDGEALESARNRLSSIRDASTVVGLEPLGRALDAFVRTLRPPGPRAPLLSPLALLDHYLDDLEEGHGVGVEPSLLLQELESLELRER